MKVREYIHEHRSEFGYNEMVMVLPANNGEEDIIGWPMMIGVEQSTEKEDITIPISHETQNQFRDMFKHLNPRIDNGVVDQDCSMDFINYTDEELEYMYEE